MEMYDLPDTGWGTDEAIVFTYRADSLAMRRQGVAGESIDITVRHSGDFAYADLPLEIKGVTPDKRFWVDTISFPLGERTEDGAYRWAGHAYSNHYDITRRYRNGIRYRDWGRESNGEEYALSIRQLTGDEPLRGILSVGVIASGARPTGGR